MHVAALQLAPMAAGAGADARVAYHRWLLRPVRDDVCPGDRRIAAGARHGLARERKAGRAHPDRAATPGRIHQTAFHANLRHVAHFAVANAVDAAGAVVACCVQLGDPSAVAAPDPKQQALDQDINDDKRQTSPPVLALPAAAVAPPAAEVSPPPAVVVVVVPVEQEAA